MTDAGQEVVETTDPEGNYNYVSCTYCVEKEIHHGRLYPNLDTLVDKGLVEKTQADRRTNEYSVTRRGTRELDARREWEDQYVADLLE